MYQSSDLNRLGCAFGCLVVLGVLVLLAVGVAVGLRSARYTVKVEATPQAAGGAK